MHGMCQQPRNVDLAEAGAATPAPVPAPAQRPATERVTNADREATATLLRRAFSDGVLQVEEFDQRLSEVYAARVAGDLTRVTDDLPGEWLADLHAAEGAQRRAVKHQRIWRGSVRTYLRVMALLVGIWLLTSLGSDGVGHPWPVWPALGWGIPLYLSRPKGPISAVVQGRRVAGAR